MKLSFNTSSNKRNRNTKRLLSQDPRKPGLISRLPEPPRKVALLRASRIGDYLCAQPALKALRFALPHAEISMITLPILKDLVDRSPYIDRYIEFPGYPGIAEQFFDAQKTAAFFVEMQSEGFDLAIQLQGSGVYSNPFMLMLGASCTAGFIRSEDSPGKLNAALPLPEHGHEVERVLSMMNFLGVPEVGKRVEFPLSAEDVKTAQGFLADFAPPYIGILPGARDETRRWPADRFAVAANTLQDSMGGTIVILGDQGEGGIAAHVFGRITKDALNLAGLTTLPALGGVIRQLEVLIANDTGPAHISYALGIPTVVIFGGADPVRYAPLHSGPFQSLAYDVPCRPCGYASCPIQTPCLANIPVDRVVEAAIRLLS